MLRYLEAQGLVVPRRSPAGYRSYGLRELDQLRALRRLRGLYAVGLDELVFAARLRHDADLRSAVEDWLGASDGRSWVEWEQGKHERLLAA